MAKVPGISCVPFSSSVVVGVITFFLPLQMSYLDGIRNGIPGINRTSVRCVPSPVSSPTATSPISSLSIRLKVTEIAQ